MDLDKFLNLIAAILGTVGAVYVMWSILAMSPELIEQQARTRWDFSVPQIESLAQQKADNVAGFIFVILAFVLTALTIAFIPEKVRVFPTKGVAVSVAVASVAVLFLILYFISQGLYEHEKFQVGKLITVRHLETIFQRGRLELSDRGNLGVLAKLLSVKEHQDESLQSLFERITAAAGLTIPEKFDYSGAKTQLPTSP